MCTVMIQLAAIETPCHHFSGSPTLPLGVECLGRPELKTRCLYFIGILEMGNKYYTKNAKKCKPSYFVKYLIMRLLIRKNPELRKPYVNPLLRPVLLAGIGDYSIVISSAKMYDGWPLLSCQSGSGPYCLAMSLI